ncbi:unnamed protein product [Chrysoparadoxa australica]
MNPPTHPTPFPRLSPWPPGTSFLLSDKCPLGTRFHPTFDTHAPQQPPLALACRLTRQSSHTLPLPLPFARLCSEEGGGQHATISLLFSPSSRVACHTHTPASSNNHPNSPLTKPRMKS